MLTDAQITAGTARLSGTKLDPKDQDQMVSVFRMFFGDLEEKYEYDFDGKLAAVDDSGDPKLPASQIAACFLILQGLGFGVTRLEGGRRAVHFSEKEEYWQYVCIAFTKFYPLPAEMSTYDMMRARFANQRKSQSVHVRRSFC